MGAPFLCGHDTDDLVGSVVPGSARIDSDGIGRCKVKISRNSEAQEIYNDIKDGIRPFISVGYSYENAEIVMIEEKDGVQTYSCRNLKAMEVSTVTIPADETVGVGRGKPDENQNPPVTVTVNEGKRKMPEPITPQNLGDESGAELTRTKEILAVAGRFPDLVTMDAVRTAIENKTSLSEFMDKILSKKVEEQKRATSDTTIGLSEKEKKQYSIREAILQQSNGKVEGFYKECHEAVQSRSGRLPQAGGLLVPQDVLTNIGTRATSASNLATSPGSAGGYLVGTQHLGSSFIELLRANMVADKVGIQHLYNLNGNVEIPKQATSATFYWVGEDTDPTASGATFGVLNMTPKTGGAVTTVSRKLLLQSDPSVDALIYNDLAMVGGLGLDLAVIAGSGVAGQPLGIKNTTGIGSTTISSATWAKALDFISDVKVANAYKGALAWLMDPASEVMFAGRVKETGIANGYILENGKIYGHPVYSTSQMTAGDVIFGDFSQVIMGHWGGLEIDTNPYGTGFPSGQVQVRLLVTIDVGVRQPTAFSLGTGAS